VDADGIGDGAFEDVSDPVGGDGVSADDEQREGPTGGAFEIDDVVEGGEEGEADAAAEEGPGRSPDAFDDGADAEEVEGEAGDDEAGGELEVAADGCLGAEELAGDEAQEHGGKRWDKAEGAVAAAMGDVGFWTREEIEEPGIEGDQEVVGFPPMGSEGLTGKWIESPGGPIAEEDGGDGEPLRARFGAAEEEERGVAETDLGECVFKGEVGLFGVCGAQEDAHQDEDEAAPEGVAEELREGGTFGEAAG